MVDNTLALLVRPPQFDLTTPMLTASRLREAENQNALSQFTIQNQMQRQNALRDFGARMRAGDAAPQNALASQPDLYASVIQARNSMEAGDRARADDNIIKNAKAAQRVLGITDPTERAAAWKEEVDTALKERRINQETYQRLSSAPPNDLMLTNLIKTGLTVEQSINLDLKNKDRITTEATIKAIAPALAGGGAGGDPSTARPATAALVRSESGGDPSIVNGLGYAGLYQFGAPRVADLGIYTPGKDEDLANWSKTPRAGPGKWSGTFNIPGHENVKTVDDFLASPAAQNTAFALHRAKMQTEIADNGFDKYVGKTVGGVPVTLAGLENALHLGGVGSTKAFLESDGQANRADRNGTTIGAYMRMGAASGPGAGAAMSTAMTPDDARLVSQLPALQLLRMSPGLNDNVAKALDKIIDHGFKLIEPDPEMKKYDLDMRQRRETGQPVMTIGEWRKDQSAAGATKITQTVGGKETSKGLVERYLKAEDAAQRSHAEIRLYETMDKLLDSKEVYTGTGGTQIAELKKIGASLFGMNFKGVSNAEVARKMTDELAAAFKAKSDDPNTSNYERRIYERMATGLNDTAAGRKLLIRMRVAELDNEQRKAQIWREHLRPDGEVDPKVFEALAKVEASRREALGSFIEAANDVADAAPQPAPTAGTQDAFDALVKKYPGLKR